MPLKRHGNNASVILGLVPRICYLMTTADSRDEPENDGAVAGGEAVIGETH